MAKFRRKPTVVDAEQFLSFHNPCRGVTVHKWGSNGEIKYTAYVITMQRAVVSVVLGEWIIAERDGKHFYPIAADEFEKVYEPVEKELCSDGSKAS